MKTRRLRLVRPKWTLGTMLLVVGWSAVVVWLNAQPRHVGTLTFSTRGEELTDNMFQYGCPWSNATVSHTDSRLLRSRVGSDFTIHYPQLAGNIAIGLLAVAVLTFASKYLVRAIVAGLRRLLSKPPPDKEEGPSESN